jgi:UDP-N-acetylglucosamine 1-carboxyvinyltransferase
LKNHFYLGLWHNNLLGVIMNRQNVKKYIISPAKLHGVVNISGAKNSVLKLLTASLLTGDDLEISNYPANLSDAQIHIGMLKALGKKCLVNDDKVVITETCIKSELAWHERSIRNTLLILGALTARTGYGAVPLPGGCPLGDRKYDLHVMLLERLGAEVFQQGDMLCAKVNGRLQGTDIHLPLRSTGATENGIICGCLASGKTTIWNPHIRPEILDLIDFLRAMGAEINVYGQERIEVVGVETLTGCKHRVIPDNMEALTWLIGATITGGDIEIHNFPYEHLEVPLIFLRESGARFFRYGDSMIVRGGNCYPVEISTGPYPGINSDMQPLLAVYGLCGQGISKIVDLRFVNRYGYARELNKMGAVSKVIENTLIIKGGERLHGTEVTALDLRAGVALVMAALIADGETVINDAWQVERGYNDFVDKLRQLGGIIKVVK